MEQVRRNHAFDRVQIHVVPVDNIYEGTTAGDEELIEFSGRDVDVEWLYQTIEDTCKNKQTRMQEYNYVLEQRRHHHSWGADATTLEFWLNVGIGAVATPIVSPLVARLKETYADIRHGPVKSNVSEANIEAIAITEASKMFGVDSSALTRRKILHDNIAKTVEVTLDDPTHRYTLRLRLRDTPEVLQSSTTKRDG